MPFSDGHKESGIVCLYKSPTSLVNQTPGGLGHETRGDTRLVCLPHVGTFLFTAPLQLANHMGKFK